MIDWFRALKGRLETISELAPGAGQVHIYDDLPSTLSAFPSAIILPSVGSLEASASLGAIEIHKVEVTIYTAGSVLPESLGTAVPFIDKMKIAILGGVTLGGLVAYCLPLPNGANWYEGPGYIKYGEVSCTGIRFHLVVKTHSSVTIV